ncbi:MAG: DNA polymerase III subunit delta [Desulfovibrionaceae bacterium]|nr:DNA polymerase III subunit delta [Desulfovibrionaceae bacterium]
MPAGSLIGSPADSERPGFLFLVCPDVQLLLETVEAKARQYQPAEGPFKRVCFWGDELPGSAFWEALSVRDLFGSMRMVLVRQANLWPTAVWKTLDKMLARPLGGSWPVFCIENDWDRGKAKIPAAITKTRCLAFAGKQGWMWSNPGITDYTVRDYVRSQAGARGLKLAPATIERLCEDTPRQAGVLSAELDKLSLLSDGSPVQPDMLGTAEWSAEAQVFTCVSCIFKGDAAGAWREIGRTTDMEAAALPMLGVMTWHLRTLWQLLAGDSVPKAGSLKPAMAQQIGAARLSSAMDLVMEADAAIKTGGSGRQIMELLCSRLLRLFGAR